MAGDLIIDKVAATSVATKTSLVRGLAKAWANLNQTGTIVLRDSLNVASLTDTGTGIVTLNFTNIFANLNFAPITMKQNEASNLDCSSFEYFPSRTTSSARLYAIGAGVVEDSSNITADFKGDLA